MLRKAPEIRTIVTLCLLAKPREKRLAIDNQKAASMTFLQYSSTSHAESTATTVSIILAKLGERAL